VEKLCYTIGILLDDHAVIDWAINVTGIPRNRILILAQPISTAVHVATLNHSALNYRPGIFIGTALLVLFIDAATMAS